ncbi:MAG: TIGR00296 family protein [Promethearchaeota archaeon]
MVTLSEGQELIQLARKAILKFLDKNEKINPPENVSPVLHEPSGVFCTLNTLSGGLRGCIGHPYPDSPLVNALIDSAISAATRDPRFPPVKLEEMKKLTIDVTVLTPPKLLEVNHPKEYLEKIIIGKHGLIAEKGPRKGLLLPQVPISWNWDVEEFLAHTCQKAFLPMMAWTEKDTKIYIFEGQVFEEEKPDGSIVERSIMKNACEE